MLVHLFFSFFVGSSIYTNVRRISPIILFGLFILSFIRWPSKLSWLSITTPMSVFLLEYCSSVLHSLCLYCWVFCLPAERTLQLSGWNRNYHQTSFQALACRFAEHLYYFIFNITYIFKNVGVISKHSIMRSVYLVSRWYKWQKGQGLERFLVVYHLCQVPIQNNYSWLWLFVSCSIRMTAYFWGYTISL